jgi:hypothetical protein
MGEPQMIVDHARAGDLDQLKAALANGCSPNEKCPRNASTPLIAAAGKGHLSIVEHVLGIGAELDHENDDGASAADAALAMGHEDIVTTLAKHELIGSTRLRFAVEQDDHKGLPELLGRWALAHRMCIAMGIAMHCALHANCPCVASALRVHCTHIATRVLQHMHVARTAQIPTPGIDTARLNAPAAPCARRGATLCSNARSERRAGSAAPSASRSSWRRS